jgi:hypothetical protein
VIAYGNLNQIVTTRPSGSGQVSVCLEHDADAFPVAELSA